MRYLIKVLSALALSTTSSLAERWSVSNAGFEMNVSKGGGRMIGPLEMKFRGWILSASREATITSESKIVKSLRVDGSKAYNVESNPAIIVFMDGCKAVDTDGRVVLEGIYMILDMESGTLTSTGEGIVQKDGTRIYRSSETGSAVQVKLATGVVTRSGEGWSYLTVSE